MQPGSEPGSRAAAIARVRAAPAEAEGWYALGRLLGREGDKGKARDCFDRAVALDLAARRGGPLQPPALPGWIVHEAGEQGGIE